MNTPTQYKGDIGVAKVMLELVIGGFHVFNSISEHLPFDLIVASPDTWKLSKLQVKYRHLIRGAVQLAFKNSMHTGKRSYKKFHDLTSFDAYAIYCPESDKIYYLKTAEIPLGGKHFNLRVTPPTTTQDLTRIHNADDFLDPNRLFS